MKSQLHVSYATQIWSPDKIALKTQMMATRWILKQHVVLMSYRDRLLTLKLLPLTFDRKLKDLVFFYKCLNGLIDLNVSDFVSFASHGQTRLSNSYNRKTPVCKTSTFQASYSKVHMTWKIFSAYLKGLSKYRRMAFFFLKIFFCFRDIDVFLLCKLDQWWRHIVCN